MGIGHPERGDVVVVLPSRRGRHYNVSRIAIVLKVHEHSTVMDLCIYEVLAGTERWSVHCNDVFLTYEDADKELDDRYCASFGVPSFESDFSGDPNWKQNRETEKHNRKHDPPPHSVR